MNGSLEVRKFLWQQDDGMARHSPSVPSQRSGEPSRISSEQVHRARVAVARSALNIEDARQLMDMLGLVPDDDGVPPVCR